MLFSLPRWVFMINLPCGLAMLLSLRDFLPFSLSLLSLLLHIMQTIVINIGSFQHLYSSLHMICLIGAKLKPLEKAIYMDVNMGGSYYLRRQGNRKLVVLKHGQHFSHTLRHCILIHLFSNNQRIAMDFALFHVSSLI